MEYWDEQSPITSSCSLGFVQYQPNDAMLPSALCSQSGQLNSYSLMSILPAIGCRRVRWPNLDSHASCYVFPLVIWQCWLGYRKGIRPVTGSSHFPSQQTNRERERERERWKYEGRSINKWQNGVILLVFKVLKKVRNIHFRELPLKASRNEQRSVICFRWTNWDWKCYCTLYTV